jgi:hypothetical protein
MEIAAKICGWGLLIAGVIIIGWTLYSSFNIFTGKAALPGIFEIENETNGTTTQAGKTPTSPTEAQQEMEKMIGEQIKGLLPTNVLSKILNLAVWSLLASILIFGGGQISGLGIKLIKK